MGNKVSTAKSVLGTFAFELMLESFLPQIINGMRRLLGGMTADQVPGMVRRKEYPYVDPFYFAEVSEFIDHLDKISVIRFAEFIKAARPDLVEALELQGMAGAEYLVSLRQHLLECIRDPKQVPKAKQTRDEYANAKCDACGKSWPVKKSEASQVTECPFCHHGRDDAA